jgi:hypothetical protein
VKIQRVAQILLGLGLVVLGSFVWNSRSPDFNSELVTTRWADRLQDVPVGTSLDISSECEEKTVSGGWILFVLDANLINDNQFRSFFETASEEMGIWITYDNGRLQLGLGLGPNSPDSNRALPIRTVRQNERATILIGVSRNETRVITNVRDVRTDWPGEFASGWSCEYVRFGDETNILSEGFGCNGCNITLRYATGEDYKELQTMFDQVSNISTFNQRRWLGSGLTLIGAFIAVVRLSKLRLRKVEESLPLDS